MNDVEVAKIENMNDFADLFLAIYSMTNRNKDDSVHISRYFKKVINHIMNTSDEYKCAISNLYNKDQSFNIEEFMQRIRFSPLKHSYVANFTYDTESDSLVTYISEERAEKTLDKHNNKVINLVNEIVSLFNTICKGLDIVDDTRILKYVSFYTENINKKSDD